MRGVYYRSCATHVTPYPKLGGPAIAVSLVNSGRSPAARSSVGHAEPTTLCSVPTPCNAQAYC